MDQAPTISIVTPSYNKGRYIRQTIESVLSQAGDFVIEYFVMDGASTDGSVDIIREYAERLEMGEFPVRCAGIRYEWVSQKDGGQSDAINRGLTRSTGSIAAYLNADDVYLPGAFATVVSTFANTPNPDFVYGDGNVIDEQGRLQWEWLSRPYNHRLMTSYHFLWNDFTNYIMQQSVFWRTDVHRRIGLFDQNMHFAMDVDYWVRAGEAGLRLRHIPIKLAEFRLIADTKSLSSPVAFWNDHLEIFRRHHGPRGLRRFLAFYYFNWIKYLDFDFETARQRADEVFERWRHLPEVDQEMLHRQRRPAFSTACFLATLEFQKRKQFNSASEAIRRGLAEDRRGVFHPLCLYAGIKQVIGRVPGDVLDRVVDSVIHWYRRYRIDYRYSRRRTAE
jgi:glycosyltransferase involved in cell wall biosynthesis